MAGLKGKSGPPGNMNALQARASGYSETARGRPPNTEHEEKRQAANSRRIDSRQGRVERG